MSEDSQTAGVVASSVMHATLLGILLVGLASAPQFDDAAESIPVDTITKEQFNAAMQGERLAKPAPAPPPPQVQPPIAKPAPPAPPEPPPELRKAEETPPPRPEPSPPPRPEPPRKPDALETPPPRPKVVEAQPPERPRETPPERPKLDQLAKLIAKEKTEEPAKETSKETSKPSAKPYDPKAIAKLIGETRLATAATPVNAGLPSARAAHMSASQERALDDWFKEAYMACWSPPPTMPEGEPYVPQIQVEFNADGTLSGQPVLVNPPSNPAWRAHAESAVRAALRCNPLKIPTQYTPFFDQWRSKTIHFDPREALG